MIVTKNSFYEILRLAHSPLLFVVVPENKRPKKEHQEVFEKVRNEWLEQGLCQPGADKKLIPSFEFQRMLYDFKRAFTVLEWWENGRKRQFVRLPVNVMEISLVRNQIQLGNKSFQEFSAWAWKLSADKKKGKLTVHVLKENQALTTESRELDFNENVEQGEKILAEMLYLFCNGEHAVKEREMYE